MVPERAKIQRSLKRTKICNHPWKIQAKHSQKGQVVNILEFSRYASSCVAYSALADCEPMMLICLQNSLSWTYWPIENQSGRVDQHRMLSLHLVLGFPRSRLPSTMLSKQSLDTPVVDLLMCPNSFRVLHFIFSKRGGSEVLLRRVVILILSINLCPRMRRIMWFWNTSMRWESFWFHVMQSRPYKTTGRMYNRYVFYFDWNWNVFWLEESTIFIKSCPPQADTVFYSNFLVTFGR